MTTNKETPRYYWVLRLHKANPDFYYFYSASILKGLQWSVKRTDVSYFKFRVEPLKKIGYVTARSHRYYGIEDYPFNLS